MLLCWTETTLEHLKVKRHRSICWRALSIQQIGHLGMLDAGVLGTGAH